MKVFIPNVARCKFTHFLRFNFASGSLVRVIRSNSDLGWFSQVEIEEDKVLLRSSIYGDLYLSPRDRVLVFLKDIYDSIAFRHIRDARYRELGVGSGSQAQVRIYKEEFISDFANHQITVQIIEPGQETISEDGRRVEIPGIVTVLHNFQGSPIELKWADAQFYALDVRHFYRPCPAVLDYRISKGDNTYTNPLRSVYFSSTNRFLLTNSGSI